MTAGGKRLFPGFTPESLAFLRELRANNRREWFEAHRAWYREAIVEPFQDLTLDLAPLMLQLDPALEVRPQVGRATSRLNRDLRFSNDKTPYRSVVWLAFKRPSREWTEAPAFYFEVSPEAYRFGMGFYTAGRETMSRFRESLLARPERFRDLVAPLTDRFVVEGDRYLRPVAGRDDLPPDLHHWYQRKNLYLEHREEAGGQLFSSELVAQVGEGFSLLAPVYHYLWALRKPSRSPSA
jgi:uncharacterized protein (TIGR02453 family)